MLTCIVEGSDDRFLLYPEQRIYRSPGFEIYALMGGMTVATVARSDLRFNRITQLNLLPQPDSVQWFEGQCYRSEDKFERSPAREVKPDNH